MTSVVAFACVMICTLSFKNCWNAVVTENKILFALSHITVVKLAVVWLDEGCLQVWWLVVLCTYGADAKWLRILLYGVKVCGD